MTNLVKAITVDEDQVAEALPEHTIHLSGNAPIEIFPFVTDLHCEVVLRHLDGESQDIELTPDEADAVAELLKKAAATARERRA